jgi:broad specificity phosphatase PhoE
MEVYFIRHGHAAHNKGFEERGEPAYFSTEFLNSELTERGHAQTLAITLPLPVDAVTSSPLVRCIQTCRNVFGDDDTVYLHDGLLESQGEHPCNVREPKSVIRNKYPNVNVSGVRTDYNPVLEYYDDVKVRGEAALKDILGSAVKNGYNRIAIVSHHNLLHALLGVSLRNAEVYRKYYSPEELSERIG